MHSRTPLLIVAQRSCGCPNPKAAQGHTGWGPEKPDLLGSNPAHGRSLELYEPSGPFQHKPFCESMILRLQAYKFSFQNCTLKRSLYKDDKEVDSNFLNQPSM